MPRNHQLVDIKPRTLHQTDQNLWIVISKGEFMSNSANITWTMRLKKYTRLTAVSILMLVKILSLATRFPKISINLFGSHLDLSFTLQRSSQPRRSSRSQFTEVISTSDIIAISKYRFIGLHDLRSSRSQFGWFQGHHDQRSSRSQTVYFKVFATRDPLDLNRQFKGLHDLRSSRSHILCSHETLEFKR